MPPIPPSPLWQPLAEGCVLLTWPDGEAGVVPLIARLARALEYLQSPEVLEWVPGLDSLALLYDPWHTTLDALERLIERALQMDLPRETAFLTHRIPTCYHPTLAPDLLEVAAYCGLTVAAFVEQHTACTFEVALLGFAPGFAYLEGLPEHLHMPRRTSPRVRVPAGSVALGGSQCGIYPLETAGGWQLIGRTPLTLFDPNLEHPSRFRLGDRVCFEVLPLEVYHDLELELRRGLSEDSSVVRLAASRTAS